MNNNLTRKAKGTYHKNVINENRLNPKNFWNAIKEIFPTKAGTKNSNSKSPQSNQKLADSFADYFSTTVRKLKRQSLRLKEFVWKSPRTAVLRTNKTFQFDYVSKVFIINFLKKMKRNKATGLDELPPRNAEGLQRVYRYFSPSHYQLFATVKDRSISLEESKAGANFQIGGSRES